jgi:hypothetical protein
MFMHRIHTSPISFFTFFQEQYLRKHGVPRRFDRYYIIRIAVDGVMRQDALGWGSEGNPEKAERCSPA